jgi:Tol biopolymer transport system component
MVGILLIALYVFASEKINISQFNPFPPPKPAQPTEKIVFVRDGNIYLVNPDGTNEVRLTEGDQPRRSPDGKKIVYRESTKTRHYLFETEDYLLCLMNKDGTGKTILYSQKSKSSQGPEGCWAFGHTWSPDGKKILFIAGPTWTEGSLYIINSDGSNLTKLVSYYKNSSVESCVKGAVFSPNGEKIAYLIENFCPKCVKKFESRLYIMDADGNNRKEISEAFGNDDYQRTIAWGPKIFFKEGENTSCIMNPDGSEKMIVQPGGHFPVWSPDGKRLAFAKIPAREDLGGIYIMDINGTITQLTNMGSDVLDWSPDGKKIVFGTIKYLGAGCLEKKIYIVDVETGNIKFLTNGSYPQWLPIAP